MISHTHSATLGDDENGWSSAAEREEINEETSKNGRIALFEQSSPFATNHKLLRIHKHDAETYRNGMEWFRMKRRRRRALL